MDLYELLGVEKRATSEELKKAYKKQALKLHPDRNYDRVDETTALFAKVQAAYDVLSDPQERAWYDSHGIAGGMGGGFGGYDDDIAAGKVTTSEDLKRYFDPMLYQNTTDGPDGIYQIASNLFTRLAQEEAEAVFDQGLDDDYVRLPVFGDSMSNWGRETKPFYDAWLGFASKKTFSWYDQYRLRDAPDRRTRRAMENQNQKTRDAARKEFNETVRALVSFIRKRDPRFKLRAKHTGATKMSAKAQANAAAREQAARDRKANASNRQEYEEQEWEKIEEEEFDEFFSDGEDKRKQKSKGKKADDEDDDENDEELDELNDGEDESDEDVVELFECVVCEKTFKTRKQFIGHEQSKKHIKAVQNLKWEMRKEGIELGIDETGTTDSEKDDDEIDAAEEDDEDEESEVEETPQSRKKPTKSAFSVLMEDATDSEDENSGSDTKPAEPVKEPKQPQKQKQKAKPKQKPTPDEQEEESIEDLLKKLEGSKLADHQDDDWSTTGGNKKNKKKGGKNNNKNKNTGSAPPNIPKGGHSNNSNGNNINNMNGNINSKLPREDLETSGTGNGNDDSLSADDDAVQSKPGKIGKAKQRRMKRAQLDDVSLICAVCQTEFVSRNKLFDHVKVSGHAAPVTLTRRK